MVNADEKAEHCSKMLFFASWNLSAHQTERNFMIPFENLSVYYVSICLVIKIPISLQFSRQSKLLPRLDWFDNYI
jgi:hypothetical protein